MLKKLSVTHLIHSGVKNFLVDPWRQYILYTTSCLEQFFKKIALAPHDFAGNFNLI